MRWRNSGKKSLYYSMEASDDNRGGDTMVRFEQAFPTHFISQTPHLWALQDPPDPDLTVLTMSYMVALPHMFPGIRSGRVCSLILAIPEMLNRPFVNITWVQEISVKLRKQKKILNQVKILSLEKLCESKYDY